MSIFVCERCQSLENTALAPEYYGQHRRLLCSACCGDKRWHGRFSRERYDPERDGPMDPATRRLIE